MSVNLVSEDDVRSVLHPFRVDATSFEANVRKRLQQAEVQRACDPLAGLAPLPRSVAAMIPLQVIAKGNVGVVAAKQAPTWFGYKLLSYLAFPAICLFLLVGAAVFSLIHIRKIQGKNLPDDDAEQAIQTRIAKWGEDNRWSIGLVFVAALILSLFGSTWLLFLICLVSFGLLSVTLSKLARVGLGNRQVVGKSCGLGLMILVQIVSISGSRIDGVHLVDQSLVLAVLYLGALILLAFFSGASLRLHKVDKIPGWFFSALVAEALIASIWYLDVSNLDALVVSVALGCMALFSMILNIRGAICRQPIARVCQPGLAAVAILIGSPLLLFGISFALTPVSAPSIKHYVESFDVAPFSSSSWHHWEIPARWTIDSGLTPDLSKPRRLLAEEIEGEQNPFVLGVAFRVGLILVEQIPELRDYVKRRNALLNDPNHVLEQRPITSLEQEGWVIRAAVMRNELSNKERDFLAKRMNVTMQGLDTDKYQRLEDALLVTELLEVIKRPIDHDQYRGQVHEWLRLYHDTGPGRFHIAGGFATFLDEGEKWGSSRSTWAAIRLMEIYGIPAGMDLDLVRSFLREKPMIFDDRKWMRAATLDRLNHLPGITSPSVIQCLYYERTLLAAMVLVAMCLYATFSSPIYELKPGEARSIEVSS